MDKVKGHSGNPWNERADQLAVAAIPKEGESHKIIVRKASYLCLKMKK